MSDISDVVSRFFRHDDGRHPPRLRSPPAPLTVLQIVKICPKPWFASCKLTTTRPARPPQAGAESRSFERCAPTTSCRDPTPASSRGGYPVRAIFVRDFKLKLMMQCVSAYLIDAKTTHDHALAPRPTRTRTGQSLTFFMHRVFAGARSSARRKFQKH